MPEGDTIHKIANFLKPRLEGQVVEALATAKRFSSRSIAGRSVTEVLARGKHLFIAFDDDSALRSHLGMYGSWHFYATGEPWRRSKSQASVVLSTRDTVYVCFNAKDVEWVRRPSVRDRVLDLRLGPDLATGSVDVGAVVRRAREFIEADAPLVDVLLDQRVACGIGNVYKSELLFIRGHLPLTRLGSMDDDDLGDCFSLAAELLSSNLGGGKRVTRREKDGAGRLWVYSRGGSPCLRCKQTIRHARLGQHHRGTYWCDDCQR